MIRFNCPHCNRPYELHPALARLPLLCRQCGQPITPPDPEPESPVPSLFARPAAPVPPPAPPKPVAPVPPPPKAAPPVAKAPAPAAAKSAEKPPVPVRPSAAQRPVLPPDDDEDEDDGVLVARPDASPDIDFNVGGPTAASLSDANRARPAGLSDATRARPAALDGAPGAAVSPDPEPPAPRRAPKPPAPQPDSPPAEKPSLLPFLADLAAFVVLLVAGMLVGELLAHKPTGAVLADAGSAPKFPPLDLILWAAPPLLLALVYLLLNGRQKTLGAWVRRRSQ